MRRKPGSAIPHQTWDGRPFHIAAFDPGGTTGVATAQWKPVHHYDELIHLGQIKFHQFQLGPHLHHAELWNLLHINGYSQIVWESFEFRQWLLKDKETGEPIPKMKIELISREYIGVLELFCSLTGTPAHHRTASSAKRFIDNEKIEQVGLWLPGMGHAMDATRHLLRYIVWVKKLQTPFTDIWLAD